MERFPLPLGAWDGLRYFIVALTEPSIYYTVNYMYALVKFYIYQNKFISINIRIKGFTNVFKKKTMLSEKYVFLIC